MRRAAIALFAFCVLTGFGGRQFWGEGEAPSVGGGSIAYESIGDVFAGTPSDPQDVDMPSDLANGDYLVAFVCRRSGSGTPTASGWTELSTHNHGAWGVSMTALGHSVTDYTSEPSNLSIDLPNTAGTKAVIVRFSNATGLDQEAGDDNGDPTSHPTPNITQTVGSGIILAAVCVRVTGVTTLTGTIPSTNIVNSAATADPLLVLGVSEFASSGTSSQGSVTFTTTSQGGDAVLTIGLY